MSKLYTSSGIRRKHCRYSSYARNVRFCVQRLSACLMWPQGWPENTFANRWDGEECVCLALQWSRELLNSRDVLFSASAVRSPMERYILNFATIIIIRACNSQLFVPHFPNHEPHKTKSLVARQEICWISVPARTNRQTSKKAKKKRQNNKRNDSRELENESIQFFVTSDFPRPALVNKLPLSSHLICEGAKNGVDLGWRHKIYSSFNVRLFFKR